MIELLPDGMAAVQVERGTACGGNCASCGGTCSFKNLLTARAVNRAGAQVGSFSTHWPEGSMMPWPLLASPPLSNLTRMSKYLTPASHCCLTVSDWHRAIHANGRSHHWLGLR